MNYEEMKELSDFTYPPKNFLLEHVVEFNGGIKKVSNILKIKPLSLKRFINQEKQIPFACWFLLVSLQMNSQTQEAEKWLLNKKTEQEQCSPMNAKQTNVNPISKALHFFKGKN